MAEEEAPKWTTDGAPLEDSNVAHIGSDEDKAARKAAAETEEAWVGAGAAPGTEVWRIEQFQVVAWPKEEYGNFYKGDSYIVLHTTADPDSGKLEYDIHFWLGSETSTDEKGTAAYKTVELDDLKGGIAVQHREVEQHESEQFLSLFKNINYMEGGIESGFRHVEPDAYIARLFMVRKEGRDVVKVIQVPLARSSLNQGDCFILDAGKQILIWNGETSSPFERNKCNMVARNMANDRNGRSQAMPWDDDAETFWMLLGGEGEIASAEEGDILARRISNVSVSDDNVLYKLSESNGQLFFSEVARGSLNMGMLDSSDVFVLDDGSEIFVWIGSYASALEKSKALTTASQYLESYDKPAHTPIHVFREGRKPNNARWKQIMG